MVDGQPDASGLLPALGVGGLFTGVSASEFNLHASIREDPDRLAVAQTRSAGDNSNLVAMSDARSTMQVADSGELDAYYQVMVSDVAVRVRQTESLFDNQAVLQRSLEKST